MHLALLHGYLLQGTGSNVYVANIAMAWKRQGHAVTVICQDRQAGSLSFVDEYIGPTQDIPSRPPAAGMLRVITPDIGGLLPVYVFDKYEGFEVKTIPDMNADEIATHLDKTAAALRAVAAQGVDRVLANHALFGPVIAKRALAGTSVPYDVKIHGSAIEYTLVPHPQFMEFALEGLGSAEKIFVGTRHVKNRVMQVFADERERLELDKKVRIVPPGMDPEIFQLTEDWEKTHQCFVEKVRQRIADNPNGRKARPAPAPAGKDSNTLHRELEELSNTYDQRATDANLIEKLPVLRPDEPIILYFGKFLSTKGVGEVLVAAPAILQQILPARLLLVGFGSYREHLEGMLQALRDGDQQAFAAYAHAGDFVEVGDLDQRFRQLSESELSRITITGILDHDTLREVLGLTSVCLVTSKWTEPFGMVAVEAMASGAFPLCNYHAGLRDVVDEVAAVSPELAQLMRMKRESFVDEMPGKVAAALSYLYPNGFANHTTRRRVGEQLRQVSVGKFSWDGIAQRLLG